MKPEIHPAYETANVTCACGAAHDTRSTKGSFVVDVCSECHPFYTGRQKVLDAAGRVERFKTRYANVQKTPKKGKKGGGEAAEA